jgi:hypothetical protein
MSDFFKRGREQRSYATSMKFALITIETERSRRHVRENRAEHRSMIEAWMAEQGRAGKLVGGDAFETEAVAPVTLRHEASGEVTVTEGPFAAGAETLGGYLLVEAADRDEAVELARSWPTEETIEVRPIWAAS